MRRALVALALLGASLTVPAVTAAGSPAAPVPECAGSSLLVAYAKDSNGYAGTVVAPFEVVNAGSRTCWVRGYPRVRFTAAGPLPSATRVVNATGGGPVAVVPARRVVLRPRRIGSFALEFSDVLTGHDATRPGCHVRTVEFTLPVLPPEAASWVPFSFNLCLAGYVVARTPIEGGSRPAMQ